MTNITIRMENEDKIQFSEICKQLGVSVSSMFNIFAKKVIRDKGIPFSLTVDPFYSKENMDVLHESINQLEEGKAKQHNVIEVK